ncbi:hypothetical protein JCM3774_005191 [Rhodotorula dairenensis]
MAAHAHPRMSSYAAATERIKYSLATSALLSANLRDALQLYPPLNQLELASSSSLNKGKGKGKARAIKPPPTTQWPQGWEHAGQPRFTSPPQLVADAAQAALKALSLSLARFSSLSSSSSPVAATTPASSPSAAAAAAGSPTRTRRPPPLDAATEAVDRFVAHAQELDLRVAAALSAIKELECIAHGLGL